MVKVKEILEIACDILDKEEAYLYILDGTGNDKQKKEADTLLKCFNLVYSELMTEYIPLKNREKVFLKSNVAFQVGALGMDLYKVIRVYDKYNCSVPFTLVDGAIKVDFGGEYYVEYSYLDKRKGFEDTICYQNYPSKRVIAYGVVAEYLLLTGVYDEAVLWNNRFKQSLKNEIRKDREIRIKPRRFL